MPRSCSICQHPQRAAIDEALGRGDAFRNMAERFETSPAAIYRHKTGCKQSISLTMEPKEVVTPAAPERPQPPVSKRVPKQAPRAAAEPGQDEAASSSPPSRGSRRKPAQPRAPRRPHRPMAEPVSPVEQHAEVIVEQERPQHEQRLLEAAGGLRRPGWRPLTPHAELSPIECADEVLATEALRLRVRGRTFRMIATELRVSSGRAKELVREEVAKRRRERTALADELIELELERCDAITDAFYDTAMAPPSGPFGENYGAQEKAARVILLASERRSRLLGLDAPAQTKHEHTGPAGSPLGVPPQLAALYQAAEAGDEAALAAIDAFAATGRLPGGEVDVQPVVVETTAEPAPEEPAEALAAPDSDGTGEALSL